MTDHSPASADFFDVVTRQRACREFAAEPVDDDDIAAVLTAATHAPSAENKQPWEFVVVRNDDTRAAIARVWKHEAARVIGHLARIVHDVGATLIEEIRRVLARIDAHARAADVGEAAVPETTQGDLLARCRAGDQRAWAELVERYSRYVHAIAIRARYVDPCCCTTKPTSRTVRPSKDLDESQADREAKSLIRIGTTAPAVCFMNTSPLSTDPTRVSSCSTSAASVSS